jgi:hypothetical protein
MDEQSSILGMSWDYFLFATASKPALGASQPPNQWYQRVLTPEIKRPGREAANPLQYSAEVKNAWSYTSTPSLRLHGVVLS